MIWLSHFLLFMGAVLLAFSTLANPKVDKACVEKVKSQFMFPNAKENRQAILKQIRRNCLVKESMRDAAYQNYYKQCRRYRILQIENVNAETIKRLNQECDKYAVEMRETESKKSLEVASCEVRPCIFVTVEREVKTRCLAQFAYKGRVPMKKCEELIALNTCMERVGELQDRYPDIVQWKAGITEGRRRCEALKK